MVSRNWLLPKEAIRAVFDYKKLPFVSRRGTRRAERWRFRPSRAEREIKLLFNSGH